MEFRKFDSIDQYRNVIKQVHSTAKWNNTPLPTVKFTGTVKLHGTSAAIAYSPATDEYQYQSRERALSLTSDNAGFCAWGMQEKVKSVIRNIAEQYGTQDSIYVYGEWAGGNIQKGVGINGLPKRMYIFKIVSDGVVQDLSKLQLNKDFDEIYSILQFKTWEIEIDFNKPEQFQNQLVEWTIEVENECPVAKYFGLENGTGEGCVWANHDYSLTMKTKGEKHTNSKVKVLKDIAPIDIQKMEDLRDFVDSVCTDNRMDQGITKLKEAGLDVFDNKNLSAFIKWVVGDILKEEGETLIENQIDAKKMSGSVAAKCRNYYFSLLQEAA